MSEQEKKGTLQFSTSQPSPGHFATQWHCQFPGCSEIIQVELTARDVAFQADFSAFDSRDAKFFVLQYLQEHERPFSTGMHLMKEDLYPRLEAALCQGDAGMLLAVSSGYAPFYCKECASVYCYRHMNYQEVWDEDYSIGGVDYWVGECPFGHHQFADH